MATLRQGMSLLLQQDANRGWVPSRDGATRLESSRGLLLECRKQAENALTVLAQSPDCVAAFMAALTEVLKVRSCCFHSLLVALLHCCSLDPAGLRSWSLQSQRTAAGTLRVCPVVAVRLCPARRP
jgi:hypothetical protein